MKYFHPHYINLIINKPIILIYTLLGYIKARYWNIRIGKKCIFNGLPIFRTLPNSVVEIGKGCRFNSSPSSNLIGVYSPCVISTLRRGAKITIGNNCGFSGTAIGAALSITLGKNVKCGANTLITDTDWHPEDKRAGTNAEVIIGDNVWLGYGVKILKGVKIGENSLIGAGSIVVSNIPPNVIAAGNPCKIIRLL